MNNKDSKTITYAFYLVVVFIIALMALGTYSALTETSNSTNQTE